MTSTHWLHHHPEILMPDLGHNPFSSHSVHGTSTNPFDEHWQPQEPSTPTYGNQMHHTPEGLEGRPPSMGGMPPRQQMLHLGGHGSIPHREQLDENVADAIDMQDRQTINNTALARSTAEAQIAQGLNEFLKSMAEMQAKSIKSGGEKLAGLS